MPGIVPIEPSTLLEQVCIHGRVEESTRVRTRLAAIEADYQLRTPRHDSSGAVESFTGWFAEFHKKGMPTLRFGIESKPDMCWCTDEWVGYRLK